MARVKGDIVIDTEVCKGCNVCVPACPSDTIALSRNVNSKGYHYLEKVNDLCTGCTNCAIVCPDAAITVYRLKNK